MPSRRNGWYVTRLPVIWAGRMRRLGARFLFLHERNDLPPRPALSLPRGGEDRLHVKGTLGGLFLPNPPDFIHNVILRHGVLS